MEADNSKENTSILEKRKGADLKQKLSITAAFCEWSLTLLIVAYMLTFVPDFQVLELGKLNLGFYDCDNKKKDNLSGRTNNTKTLPQAEPQSTLDNIINPSKKQNHKAYLGSNYPSWSMRRHKTISSDMQVVKCASYRDVGTHEMSFTLSSSSSFMSDSRTTNASQCCDNPDHLQQCRHLLLDESLDRGSNNDCECVPVSSVETKRKVLSGRIYDTSRYQTPTLHEIPDADKISICFPETA